MKIRKQEKQEQPDLLIRAATVESIRAEGDTLASVRMSVSSEEPVLTSAYFNDQWQRVYEVLDHKPESIDMSRCKDGLVVLDRHYGDQIGLMRVEVKDGKIGGVVEFCSGTRAQEISKDAAKGLRRNVSVGYIVSPDAYRIEGEKDGVPVVRATRWTPYEASFEPVPADTTVGVNRAAEPAVKVTAKIEVKQMDPKVMEEIAALRKLIEDGNKQKAEIDSLRAKIVELETRKVEKPAEGQNAVVPPIGGSVEAEKKAVRNYSLMNVIRNLAGGKVDITLERELSDECAKLRGKEANGIIIPHAALAKRDFTKLGTSSYSIATNLLASEFIDLLRTKTILAPLGVQFMSGLVGDVAIPKMSAGATGYWVAESGDITESAPTLGQVTGSPHTAGVMVDISRRLMQQSTPDAETMVRDEIIQRIARTIQIAVFAGTGADGQPSAITNATGINNPSVTQGTPTYAEILGFISAIMADNAEADGMKWAMTAEVWAKLAATMRTATYGDIPVLDPAIATMLGYGWVTSEDLPANSLWFGNWRSVVVGVWGNGVDINADTATLSSQGGLRLVGLQDVDVMVRQGAALAYNTAVTS